MHGTDATVVNDWMFNPNGALLFSGIRFVRRNAAKNRNKNIKKKTHFSCCCWFILVILIEGLNLLVILFKKTTTALWNALYQYHRSFNGETGITYDVGGGRGRTSQIFPVYGQRTFHTYRCKCHLQTILGLLSDCSDCVVETENAIVNPGHGIVVLSSES